MSRQIQIRRGTAAEHTTFTGAIGEITMDTTNKTIRVHDGTTAGGTILAKQSEIPEIATADYVTEWQNPTADNNYTWYRKYKSGWVEQGGYVANTVTGLVISLPVEMANIYYDVQLQSRYAYYGTATNTGAVACTTTSFTHHHYNDTNQSWTWCVRGIAA